MDNPGQPTSEQPSALSAAEAAERIRSILQHGGHIFPSPHFHQRCRERNFGTQDALEVLRNGSVKANAVWNDRVCDWNYDVEGTDIEGEALTIRVAFLSSMKMLLVTGF